MSKKELQIIVKFLNQRAAWHYEQWGQQLAEHRRLHSELPRSDDHYAVIIQMEQLEAEANASLEAAKALWNEAIRLEEELEYIK